MIKGDIIIIPTDTVYGLAAKLYDEEALKKIYKIKGRDQSKQIPILISDIKELDEIAEYDQFTLKVMETFWPGPLTIVLKTTDIFKSRTGEETIAVRMPNHPKALEVLRKGGVMRVTSLNKSGEAPLEDRDKIQNIFGSHVRAIFWQGKTKCFEQASTVAKVSLNHVEILREGVVTKEDILSLRSNRIAY